MKKSVLVGIIIVVVFLAVSILIATSPDHKVNGDDSGDQNNNTGTPDNVCAHDYETIEYVSSTCAEAGRILERCSLCGHENEITLETIEHDWGFEEIAVMPTCQTEGYTESTCAECGLRAQRNVLPRSDHEFEIDEYVFPTYESEGYRTSHCYHCGYVEKIVYEKLGIVVAEAYGMRVELGKYSFVTVKDINSQYYGKTAVKIPIKVTKISDDPSEMGFWIVGATNSLGDACIDLAEVFEDDIDNVEKPEYNETIEAFIYFVYKNDGLYHINFYSFLFGKESVDYFILKECAE